MKIDQRDGSGSLQYRSLLTIVLPVAVLACLLAFLPRSILWAERFALPKEVVLHGAALAGTLVYLVERRTRRADGIDAGVACFAALGFASTILIAHNPWLAWRSASLATSAVILFVLARRTATAPPQAALLLEGVCWALGALATTALLEAYGVFAGLSPLGRAPGGTLGNRNRAAHLIVLGLPALWLAFSYAPTRRRALALLWCSASASALLVLSRTRAAWLAALVVGAAVVSGYLLLDRPLRLHRRTVVFLVTLVVAGAAAILAPNALRWKSNNGYDDVLRRLAEHGRGSGQGRMIQYGNTARMVRDHPLLGVGPGNWGASYLAYATVNDPSVSSYGPVPVARDPQSDWLGIAAEQGIFALLALVYAGVLLVIGPITRLRGSTSAFERDRGAVLGLTILALLVVGSLDAVLLTPAAACFAAVVLGSLGPTRTEGATAIRGTRRWSYAVPVVALTAAALFHGIQRVRAGMWAGNWAAPFPNLESVTRAVELDPGSVEARLALIRALILAGRCDRAETHLQIVERHFPGTLTASHLRRVCGARRPRMDEPPSRG